ncbi:MAG: hypothetical protein ACOYM3_13110 [Terrimicrobiaceae bacterium]
MRFLWITLGIVFSVAIAAVVASSLWIGSYVRSEPFRRLISNATGEVFDATAVFEPLRWTGSSVYSESSKLQGTPGSGLRQLEASQLRAEVNWRAAFSGAWRVEEISMTRLDGEWGPSEKASAADRPPATQSPAGLAALLPHRFELGLLKISSANLAFAGTRISNSALSIRPDGSGWVFQGTGGELQLPWPPLMGITSFRAREQGGDLFLTEGKLRVGENGKITASGESSGGGRLQFAWEDVKAADVLDASLRKYVEGTLSGNAIIRFPGQVSGTLRMREGRIENIPLLATVSDFTGNPSFRRMPLQELTGDFTYESGTLHVKNFSAESKGLMRIEGSVVIEKGGALQGRFEIGVTPQTLQWLPGSRERVFKQARNGYLWTELSVGGTVEHPTENLSSRLLAAMGVEVIEQGANLLKNTPEAATEGVRGVLDILRPLIP